jgi:hypothetical protein
MLKKKHAAMPFEHRNFHLRYFRKTADFGSFVSLEHFDYGSEKNIV